MLSPLQISAVVAALTAAALLVWSIRMASKCSAGGRIWLLALIRNFYIRVMINWQANRACPFPSTGPAIIVGNHTSPVDPVLIWHRHNHEWPPHQTRVIGWMVASEFYHKRGLIGWICRAMQCIPVKRTGSDMRAVRLALSRLKEGRWLGIFPEGGINRTPENGLRDASTGVAYLALKSGVPVYPVWIHDAPRSRSMVRCFLKRSRVRLTFGEPLSFDFGDGKTRLTTERLEEVTAVVMRTLEELSTDRWWESDRSTATSGP